MKEMICGFILGCFFTIVTSIVIFSKPNTKTTQEIIDNIKHSTNIVNVLKNENYIIKDVVGGYEADTVEIIIEYDFLFKNKKGND